MYALILVRYRRPLSEVETVTEAHRAYLGTLKAQGVLLASGPLDPRFGGAWLVRVQDENPLADLDTLRDGDPFYKAGLANYELLPWNVMAGKDGFDQM
ncbi:MAG TPA: YciI family protein [Geothrix sp.]